MYFEDLSPYAYDTGHGRHDNRLLNFGWLDREHPFPRGTLETPLLGKLGLALLNYKNVYRGTHPCEFCDQPDDLFATVGEERMILGHSELWIPSTDGRIFIAPSLAYHYIEAHHYLPPDDVISALRDLPKALAQWDTPDGYYRKLVGER